MSTDIRLYYEFILAQFAAESYLNNVDTTTRNNEFEQRLSLGANNPDFIEEITAADELSPTQMTEVMIDDFFATWEIVDHRENQPSGFSGTLLRHKETGELTLSFRSAEFQDVNLGGDIRRDGFSGAFGEIAHDGFAVAQIMDMENYYQSLIDNGDILPNTQINVTGVSSGGHLAQAFTRLHFDNILHTYTFNGAGFGDSGVLAPQSNADGQDYKILIENLLGRVNTVFNDPLSFINDVSAGELVKINNFIAGSSVFISIANLLLEKLNDKTGLNLDVTFLADLTFTEERKVEIVESYIEMQSEFIFDNTYGNPLYLFATRAAANFLGTLGIDEVTTGEITPDNKITNLFGDITGNLISQTGQTFGESLSFFVEDQPIDVPDFDSSLNQIGDFLSDLTFSTLESTQSITLLADTLALMDLITSIDPDLGTGDPDLARGELNQILSSASTSRASNVPFVRKAEGDTLEVVLDALGNFFLPDTWQATPVDFGVGKFGDIALRNSYYNNLELLRQELFENGVLKSAYQDLGLSIESLHDVNTGEIITLANDSIAYRYTLQELNPFVIKAISDVAETALYAQHNMPNVEGTGLLDIENFSDEYLADRAAFLVLKIELGIANKTDKGSSENITYSDSLLGISLDLNKGLGNAQLPHQKITFTSSKAGETAFAQGGSKADRLYGFQGNDILVGGKGQKTVNGETVGDFLEGGDGNDTLYSNNFARDEDNAKDTLRGGKGEDAYYVGDGDEIEDSDRTVQFIEFNSVIIGGQYVEVLPDQYENLANNNITLEITGNDAVISLAQGSLTKTFAIKNFKDAGVDFTDGDYGITLLDQAPPAPIEFNGTVDKDIIGVDATGTQVDLLDDMGNVVGGQTFGTQVKVIRGMEDSDFIQVDADIPNITIYGDSEGDAPGADGDDFIEVDRTNVFNDTTPTDFTQGATIYGEAGDDFISGSQRNDFIHGQEDHDFIKGNNGADIIFGSTGNDFIEGGKNSNGFDQLFGGDDNDYVLGGAGTDLLLGGAGDDRLYGDANSQGFFRNEFGTFYDGATQSFNIFNDPFSNFQSALTEVDVTEAGDDFLDGGLGDDELYGGAGDDTLNGGADNDILQGEAGNDLLRGGAGDDTLWGDKDADSYDNDNQAIQDSTQTETFIFRQHADAKDVAGDDILDGGTGTDKLYGGDGNDTYKFSFGYGKDFVLDEAGDTDKIELGSGITPDNIELAVGDANNNLIIKLKTLDGTFTGDELTISNYFNGNGIESLQFASGLSWNTAFVEQITGITSDPAAPSDSISSLIIATENADIGLGDDNNNEIHTLGGNDLIAGGGGNDRLFGGAGNDELQGNNGDDILQGDEGNDRLFGQLGNDQLYGGAGSDNLFGNEGNDTLTGGTGTDNLSGGTGNDTYLYNRGDGDDLILDDGGNDRIKLGEGISADDISVQKNGNDLILQALENGIGTTDIITIADWFNSDNQIETIQFDDGSSWDASTITALLPDDNILVNGQTTQGSNNASVYRFQPSADITDGFNITIDDAGGIDQLLFEQAALTIPGSGTFFATPVFDSSSRDGNDLVINVSVNSNIGTIPDSTGQVRITNYYSQTGFIETIKFPDQILNNPNLTPVLSDTAVDQIILADVPYNFQLSPDSFTDTPLDILKVNASLSDGSALPAWLSFDAESLTFSGTPIVADSEIIDVAVTATDSSNQSVSLNFNLNVGNVNLAPEVANDIEDQVSRSQRAFSFQVAVDTFSDINLNESLTFSASLSDGSDLPTWLTFDDVTGTFSGTPADVDIGSVDVRVTATDSGGLSSSDNFTLTTNEFNSVPVANADDVTISLTTQEPTAEFLVNTTTAGTQVRPTVASLADNSLVMVWLDEESTILAQRLDKDGNKLGAEFVVNDTIPSSADRITVAGLTGGDFVISWRGEHPVTEALNVYAQRFNSNGDKIDTEFSISGNNSSEPTNPKIASLPNGGFVVVWEAFSNTGGSETEIFGQRFDANSDPVGSEFQVNTFTQFEQIDPQIAVQADGSFMVVWDSGDFNRPIPGELADETPLSARFYDSQGNAVGGEQVLSVGLEPSKMIAPRVTALSTGDYVVTWSYSSSEDKIYAQKFNAAGSSQGQPILINPEQGLSDRTHSVVADTNGGFVVSWSTRETGEIETEGTVIVAAQFDALGQQTTFLVNEQFDGNQQLPAITLLNDGGLAIVWKSSSTALGDLDGGIAARIFPSTGNPAFLIDVLANDTDADVDDDVSNFSLDVATVQGEKGTVTIENNQIKFDPGNDFNGLTAGETETVTIDYTMSDDSGESSSTTLTFMLRGSTVADAFALSDFTILQNGGQAVASAGDFNGDGFDDVLVQGTEVQGSYLVYGQAEEIPSTLDLSLLDGSNGFHINVDISSISGAGDVNGDGFADVIVSIPATRDPGSAFILFGRADSLPANVDLASLNVADGVQITGSNFINSIQINVSDAGDINGDGVADLIIGSADTNGSTGEVSVVFGRTEGFTTTIDLDGLDGSNGFHIPGVVASSNTGATAQGIGDLNDDGIDDLFVFAPEGIPGGSPDPRNPDGADPQPVGYVVFGQTIPFNSNIDLTSLDGTNGFQITAMEGAGASEARGDGIGDFNGDGIDDFVINTSSFQSHIIFGKTSEFSADVNPGSLSTTAGITLDASNTISAVSRAGDVNGDGLSDVIVSAASANSSRGASYIVFGDNTEINSPIDLDTLDGQNGFQLTGNSVDALSGRSVSAAGDVNGDGFDDLLISAPGENNDNGESYIVYGRDFRNEVDDLGTSNNNIVNVVESGQQIFTLGGDDIINVGDVETVDINTGSGSNEINFSAGGSVTRRVSLTSSSGSRNNVRIGSSSSPVTKVVGGRYIITMPGFNGGGSNNAFDIYTGGSVSTSSIRIRRGSLIIDIDDGFIELHFTDVNTNNLSTVTDLFERITFNDNFTLTYQDILELGFDFEGTNDNDELFGTEITDRINGFDGNDVLDGGKGNDELDGGTGNDVIIGGEGNDIIIGNIGDDDLVGGVRDDTYIINIGDGNDIITDTEGTDKIIFGAGLSVTDLNVSQSGDDLLLSLGVDQTVTINNWFVDSNTHIEQFVFTGDNLLSLSSEEIENLISGNTINLAPGVNTGLIDQVVDENETLTYTIATNTFVDPDSNDPLTYSATLSDGTALPAWLDLDAITGTFSGTPADGDVGDIEVEVTATDSGGLGTTDRLTITVNDVANTNEAPILANEIADQNTDEDALFSFTIPADTFSDINDTLIYSATLTNGLALPIWLNFDAATQTFSGMPDNDDVDVIDVQVTATDTGGLSVNDDFTLTINNVNDSAIVSSDAVTLDEADAALTTNGILTSSDIDNADNVFTASNTVGVIGTFDIDAAGAWSFEANNTFDNLNVGDSVNETYNVTSIDGTPSTVTVTINGTNDAPTISNVITDQVTNEDVPFSFTIPTNTFEDVDVGDTLTYNATLGDDSALPTWLTFDAVTQTFSGTPDNNNVGVIDVKVTATDTGGLSVSDTFSMTINNVNDAPVVATALVDQTSDEDAPFSFTIPTNTFEDVDVGDTLTYNATLGDDSALPTWLTFDTATQTFSGTPDNNDVGVVDVKVTAADTGGLSVSDEFSVIINNVNDNPLLSNSIDNQSTNEDQAFSFSIPANTFVDDDSIHGDTFSYSVGSTLPSWLSFDADTQTFAGTPFNEDVGEVDITVIATDTGGLSASDTFSLTINNVNDAPVLLNPLSDQSIAEGQQLLLSIPSNTFFDDDLIHGDQLSFSANLADGSALPTWINIDPVSGTLSGNAPYDAAGGLSITVTATDSSGISANDTFNLEIINTINGSSGNDELEGTSDKDIIYGFGGNDEIEGKSGDDQLFGGSGNDELEGDDGDDVLDGGSGNDELEGGKGNDQLFGGSGNDELEGDDGNDLLDGGSGNDELEGGKGNDQLFGGSGNDELEGDDGNDLLDGGSGNDELEGGKGNDQLFGGSGNDELEGGKGDDFLDGGSGNDELEGDKGNDQLFGGSGNDELEGGKGDDFLDGGSGNDELEGEKGDDTYQFNRGYDMDRITDDDSGDDRVLFADVNHNELWFWREGDDLQIGILNTLDRLTVEDWYDGDNRIETFNTTDDKYALSESNVQQLVDAMATFSVTNSGSLDVPQNVQDDVQSVITTAWQAA
jgi:VCBS repeat-containing protein